MLHSIGNGVGQETYLTLLEGHEDRERERAVSESGE
jgi:hypothetical protein